MKTLLHDMDVREEERQRLISFIGAIRKSGMEEQKIKEALINECGLDAETAELYLNNSKSNQ